MLEFKGFHPKDVSTPISLKLTDSGVEYVNLENQSFQFIPYCQIAGYSGWKPGYGSLHIYSVNPNLIIHVNFPAAEASSILESVKQQFQAKL